MWMSKSTSRQKQTSAKRIGKIQGKLAVLLGFGRFVGKGGDRGIVRSTVLTDARALLGRAMATLSRAVAGREVSGGIAAMNCMTVIGRGANASIAAQELRGRFEATRLEFALTGLACELCVEQIPLEMVFERLQDRALEKLVRLLDTRILDDPAAIKTCLEMVAEESERVAWGALERGTEMLSDGLDLLTGEQQMVEEGGFIH